MRVIHQPFSGEYEIELTDKELRTAIKAYVTKRKGLCTGKNTIRYRVADGLHTFMGVRLLAHEYNKAKDESGKFKPGNTIRKDTLNREREIDYREAIPEQD